MPLEQLPQLDQRLLYGVGLGLRYYTPFGPLRLDLATPLYKRSADSWMEVYVSLGGAFLMRAVARWLAI